VRSLPVARSRAAHAAARRADYVAYGFLDGQSYTWFIGYIGRIIGVFTQSYLRLDHTKTQRIQGAFRARSRVPGLPRVPRPRLTPTALARPRAQATSLTSFTSLQSPWSCL
jgi:hypothetical protein